MITNPEHYTFRQRPRWIRSKIEDTFQKLGLPIPTKKYWDYDEIKQTLKHHGYNPDDYILCYQTIAEPKVRLVKK